MTIAVVVVTYNRKELLAECINALLGQTFEPNTVFIINNASTDGTETLFQEGGTFFHNEKIQLLTMPENLGGSGGFYEGMKRVAESYDDAFDWIWIMDDDTIPTSNALEELVKCAELISRAYGDDRISYLASSVYGINNEPMNVPSVCTDPTENGYSDWYTLLDECMVRIRTATFVSIMINMNAIKELGYPIKEYFLWGDDMEYTNRLSHFYGKAYLCGKSKVIHKRANTKAISLEFEDNPNRIKLFDRYYRNILTNYRMYFGKSQAFKTMVSFEIKGFKMLQNSGIKYRSKKFFIIQRGIFKYLRDYKTLKSIRDKNIKQ